MTARQPLPAGLNGYGTVRRTVEKPMKLSLSITVDCLAGDSIDATAAEMVALADRLQIAVRMDTFNGVRLTAYPGGSATKLARAYGKAMQGNFQHREADSDGDASTWNTLQEAVDAARGLSARAEDIRRDAGERRSRLRSALGGFGRG